MPLLYLDKDDPFKNGAELSTPVENLSKITPLTNSAVFYRLSKEVDKYKDLDISAAYLFDSNKKAAFCNTTEINGKERYVFFINRKMLNLPEQKFLFVVHHEAGHAVNRKNQDISNTIKEYAKSISLATMAVAASSLVIWSALNAYNGTSVDDTSPLREAMFLPLQDGILKFSIGSAISSAASMLITNLTYRYNELFCDNNGFKHTKVDSFPDIKGTMENWKNRKERFEDFSDPKKILKDIESFFYDSTHPFLIERNSFIKILNAKDKVTSFVQKVLKNNDEASINRAQ